MWSKDYFVSDLDILCVELNWKIVLGEGQAYTKTLGRRVGSHNHGGVGGKV